MFSTTNRFSIFLIQSALFSLIFFTTGNLGAQDDAEVISQFRRTVFKLQQEMLELKGQIDRQQRELRAQKEELGLQVERLNQENSKMKKHLQEMDSLIFQMEDRLETSSLVKLSKQLETLRNFNQAMIMDSVSESDQPEKILLDILNQPESSLPKDLLILILAQQKKRHKQYDESLSYYSTLLAEFSNSEYFSQAIFEMSNVFGETDKKDQQLTLLAQLSSLSETDPYSIKAQEKLRELGAEDLFEEAAIRPVAKPDVPKEHLETETKDTSSDTVVEQEAEEAGDASGDSDTTQAKDDSQADTTSDIAAPGMDESSVDGNSEVEAPAVTPPPSNTGQADATTDVSSDPNSIAPDSATPATVAPDKEEPDMEATAEETSEVGNPQTEEKPKPEPDYTPESQQPNQAD